MNAHIDSNRIFDEAIRWVSRFADGTADTKAFFAWLAESPRHVEELSFALALSEEISALAPERRQEIEKLTAEQTGGSRGEPADIEQLGANVIPLPQARSGDSRMPLKRRAHWKTLAWAASLAAVAISLSVAGYWMFGPGSWVTYTTQVGEQRALTLADGSVVQLNTRSRLEVRLTATSRELRLMDGQALFKVQHDAARPFRVHTPDAVIQAIGTQFDVYRRPAGTSVSVLEGIVQIAPAATDRAITSRISRAQQMRVVAGEKADIELGTATVKRVALNPVEAAAWRQRRLVFHDDALADIAAEFNRYNKAPQIRVEGSWAADQRFAGTFDADAPEALLAALADHRELVIERSADEITIRAR
jgi:transmembrane sensor